MFLRATPVITKRNAERRQLQRHHDYAYRYDYVNLALRKARRNHNAVDRLANNYFRRLEQPTTRSRSNIQ